MDNFPRPLNINERYAYEQLVRLDALCSMVESIVKHIAEKEGIATESNGVEEVESEVNEVIEEVIVVEEEETEQCKGVTAKGNRCKRDAQEGSEYCSVHEPKE